jgi:hypothetical protein
MKNLLCFILFLAYSLSMHAQSYEPQFKFWLAFEDATGAKDTLWLIMDSTAKIGPNDDPHLGEVMLYDTTENFKVSFDNYLPSDTLRKYKMHKVLAVNSSQKGLSAHITSFNYQLPITIRYDTNIFNNNGLPYEFKTAYLHNYYSYFYLNNTQHFFIYLKEYISGGWMPDIFDSVTLPYVDNNPNFSHFPLEFYLDINPFSFVGVSELERSEEVPIIYPNPTTDVLNVINKEDCDCEIAIYNVYGQKVFGERYFPQINKVSIDISFLENGIYILHINNLILNKTTNFKFVKQ